MKAMYDRLFAANEAAVVLHEEVRKIFKEESQSFFDERIKWMTDARQAAAMQDSAIEGIRRVADEVRRKTDLSLSTM